MHAAPPTVVVYGGHGFFGRLVVEDVLRQTAAHVVIAGRSPPLRHGFGSRVSVAVSDLSDLARVEATVRGAAVVVHCAGPYQALPLNPLRAAIEEGVHYVDLADDREFVRRVHEMDQEARQADISVLSGLSVVPGIAALLTQTLRANFQDLNAVRTFVAPGTRGSRGLATFLSLLSAAGRPFRLPRQGQEHIAYGWTEPEWVPFPPPVGWRLSYLAIPVADFDLLPRYFGVGSVEFKAGSEYAWLNRLLGLSSRLRSRIGVPRLDRWAPVLRRVVRLAGWFGTDRGAVLVEVSGSKDGQQIMQQIAVVAQEHGERIPAVLAGMGVAALLEGKLRTRGVVPLHTWLEPADFLQEISRRGLSVWWKPAAGSDWRTFPA